MPEEPDVIVVGGGIAGLAAATTAARHGSKVVLVDAHHLGGRAQSDHRRGFTFNRGPHALYDRGAGRDAVLTAHLAG
jgi:phytoene dehydrogenase-like protein